MKKLNKTLLIGGVSLAVLVPVSIAVASDGMPGNGRGNGQSCNNSQRSRACKPNSTRCRRQP